MIKFMLGLFLLATAAQANPVPPAPVEESSPALQLARRVASMENNKDLPSRAVWLGKLAAQNTRLLAVNAARKTKKKPVVVSN